MGTYLINVKYVITYALYIGGRAYLVQLTLLDMLQFDVILDMD